MPSVPDNQPEGMASGSKALSTEGDGVREADDANRNYGKRGSRGPWVNLTPEKRQQYERIEERVRKKMERGEL